MLIKFITAFNPLKSLLFLLVFSFSISQAQSISLKICDSITPLTEQNACIFKVYNQSQKVLDKAYASILQKFTLKSKSKNPKTRKNALAYLQFLKDAQTQWILTRDYNAKVHQSYELTALLAEKAFYYSKASENLNRMSFLISLKDSLETK